MLHADYGGLRPWELELFKPSELMAVYRYRMELKRARELNA